MLNIMPKREKKPLVGVITVPLSPDKKYFKVCGDSYIASSHHHMLKDVGLDTVAIPYTTDDYEYYLNRINGLYFPSGGVFALNSRDYYQCCKRFMKGAIDRNDNGEVLPIWGGCMGMQQMLMIADNRDNLDLLEESDSFDNLMSTLVFKVPPEYSQLFRDVSGDLLYKLATEECTLNNHRMGLSLQSFVDNPRISGFFCPVTTSFDRQEVEYVSTIEAYDYPFYGFQWHPERDKEMYVLAEAFARDCYRSPVKIGVANRRKLPYRKVNCMTYSDNLYKYCYFYWHKRSSIHNRKLCSVLHLGVPVSNAI